MPRRKDPPREINIKLDEESIRDALSLWIHTHHGIIIDAKSFTFEIADQKLTSAVAKKRPRKVIHDDDGTDRQTNCDPTMGVLPQQVPT